MSAFSRSSTSVDDGILATAAPPDAAAWDKVTVQVEVPPEVTVAGAHCTLLTFVNGVTVTDVVDELPFKDAVIVTL